MKLNEIYKIADGLAPKAISDEYCRTHGAYDNSGVLIDCGEEINGIVFSLDLSFGAIDKAIECGANLIITHHPGIYGKINHARCNADDLTERKLVKCLRNGISVISMHLNLDMVDSGIDENLMLGVCLSADKTTGAGMRSLEDLSRNTQEMHEVTSGAYGRAYDIAATTLGALAKEMQTTFSTKRILTYGKEDGEIKRAASFCGAGADNETVAFAKRQNADVIVSADFKHHVITDAVESGLSVVVLTHYASENYGFKKYYEKIRELVDISCVYHEDANLL